MPQSFYLLTPSAPDKQCLGVAASLFVSMNFLATNTVLDVWAILLNSTYRAIFGSVIDHWDISVVALVQWHPVILSLLICLVSWNPHLPLCLVPAGLNVKRLKISSIISWFDNMAAPASAGTNDNRMAPNCSLDKSYIMPRTQWHIRWYSTNSWLRMTEESRHAILRRRSCPLGSLWQYLGNKIELLLLSFCANFPKNGQHQKTHTDQKQASHCCSDETSIIISRSASTVFRYVPCEPLDTAAKFNPIQYEKEDSSRHFTTASYRPFRQIKRCGTTGSSSRLSYLSLLVKRHINLPKGARPHTHTYSQVWECSFSPNCNFPPL